MNIDLNRLKMSFGNYAATLKVSLLLIVASIIFGSCYASQYNGNNYSKVTKEQRYEKYPRTDVSAITTPYEGKVYKQDEISETSRFPACEGRSLTMNDLNKCAQEEMLKYIYSHLSYPAIARENRVQGTVTLEFVVTPEGDIRSAKINKEPGAGTGGSALDMLAAMDKEHTWKPALIDDKPVAVLYVLPVRFKLA